MSKGIVQMVKNEQLLLMFETGLDNNWKMFIFSLLLFCFFFEEYFNACYDVSEIVTKLLFYLSESDVCCLY